MKLSVAIITLNEEANLPRTLASVAWADEVVVVDSGSTDRTCEIAAEAGARVLREAWQGFAAQKNSAIAHCSHEWVLSLDADEEVSPELADSIRAALAAGEPGADGYFVARRNLFLGRWIRRGGFYPDRKLRLFRGSKGRFEDRPVHETARVDGRTAVLSGDLIHHAYPTLAAYLEHMNRYSTLGAEVVRGRDGSGFSLTGILVRPAASFFYNYILRMGFLDGREGLLLHLYQASYASWKYAKAWELSRVRREV